jgi:thioredoxin reductase (NADPH)
MQDTGIPFAVAHTDLRTGGKSKMANQEFEVLVVGAGPAGLSAALYLARFDRTVGLFDTGQGRSTWHQTNYNFLGFPGGIKSRKLRDLGCQQLEDYPQVTAIPHKVETMRRDGEWFIASGQAGEWRGKTVILCTGVTDHYPHFDGWDEYVGRSMFWCITCDGYGSKDKRVVVVGNNNGAASEALQLQRFTPTVTVLTNSEDCAIADKFQDRLERHHIPLIHDKIDTVNGHDGVLEAIITKGGIHIPLDQLFNQQGATPQTKLAQDLGVLLSSDGYIQIDTDQQTNIPGVFAAGDVTRLFSHQISTAVHEGGTAASAANYFLYPPDLKDD